MAKLNIHAFVAFLEECAARKDGYIMGTLGQDPKKLSSWYYDQYTGSQRTKALYWRENAKRVWDCQGLSEGYINDMTGSHINLRARNNYALWCDPKGTGSIPTKYKTPGAAVFVYSKSAGAITHVGYLVRPVKAGKPEGDWYVVEARGVMYGVVTTKLNSRGWNRWGLMTQYFDYDVAPPEGAKPVLRKGDKGAVVKDMQARLIAAGYDLGKWGADGDYGAATEAAVQAFQRAVGLSVDGVYGKATHAALTATKPAVEDEPDEPTEPTGSVVIQGGSVYIRSGPGTQYDKVGVARTGDRYELAEAVGWVPVLVDGEVRYVSAKFVKVQEG